MRQAEIYYKDILSGLLTKSDDGEYVFQNAKQNIQGSVLVFYPFL